jgi:hypothetical protein
LGLNERRFKQKHGTTDQQVSFQNAEVRIEKHCLFQIGEAGGLKDGC